MLGKYSSTDILSVIPVVLVVVLIVLWIVALVHVGIHAGNLYYTSVVSTHSALINQDELSKMSTIMELILGFILGMDSAHVFIHGWPL